MIAQACALIELTYPDACLARNQIVKQLQQQHQQQQSKPLYVYKGAQAGAPLFFQDQAHFCVEQAVRDSKQCPFQQLEGLDSATLVHKVKSARKADASVEKTQRPMDAQVPQMQQGQSSAPLQMGQSMQTDTCAIFENCVPVGAGTTVELDKQLNIDQLPVCLDLPHVLSKHYGIDIDGNTPVVYIFKAQVSRCISAPLKEGPLEVLAHKIEYEKAGWCTQKAPCVTVDEKLTFINDVDTVEQIEQALVKANDPTPYSSLFARALHRTYVSASDVQGVLVLNGPVWMHYDLRVDWS